MSEEDKSQKTEEPTQKRLDDARKKGDVAKSMEVAGFATLAAGTLVVFMYSGPMARGLARDLSGLFAGAHLVSMDQAGLLSLFVEMTLSGAKALAIPLALIASAGLAGHLLQTGLVVSAEKMKPNPNKLSPIAGLGRLFGPAGAANFGKGVAKMVAVGAALGVAFWPHRHTLAGLPAAPIQAILHKSYTLTMALLLAALVVYAIIAVLDFVGQRHSFNERQKMSRQEIKDEGKQSEGDPMVKARLKQIRMQRAKQRMMAAIPDATVIVTNPTHYAVALKYVEGETPAPICVAKGVDAVALRIREIAALHDVPVVEEPPLARALHATVDIGDIIPKQHYEAVARVIGAILSLAKRRARPAR